MRPLLPMLFLLALAAGCDRQSAAGEGAKLAPTAAAIPAALPSAALPSAVASAAETKAAGRDFQIENDLYDFEYKYPAQAGAIPALKDLLEADLEQRKAELEKAAKADRDEMKANGFPYRPHSYDAGWDVVTDIPGWLSLSAQIGTYTGGAHGNHFFDDILWDKQAGRRRSAVDLFMSKQALSKVIRNDFCDALDRQRANKRGAKINRASGEEFDKCIDPVAYTVILGSSDRKAFNRIGILVPPYEAGPYVEGDYEVTLPVTQAILAQVKPEYRPSFSIGR